MAKIVYMLQPNEEKTKDCTFIDWLRNACQILAMNERGKLVAILEGDKFVVIDILR